MIFPHHGVWPEIHETAFVAPSCDLIGDIKIGAESSIWFQCVLRGDVNIIRIGDRTNIQDLTMIHVTRKKSPTHIGSEVTVGHRAMIHGCTIGDQVLVGMGSIIMDDAILGDRCVVGAGALVTEKKKIPPKSLVMGTPAKVVRQLTDTELSFLEKSASNYVKDAEDYRSFILGPKKYVGEH